MLEADSAAVADVKSSSGEEGLLKGAWNIVSMANRQAQYNAIVVIRTANVLLLLA